MEPDNAHVFHQQQHSCLEGVIVLVRNEMKLGWDIDAY